MEFKISERTNTHSKISIIIPFMFNGDRWKLFDTCIRYLYHIIKDDKDVELVVHETGDQRKLRQDWIEKYNVKYEFTRWKNVFHRGWSLNYAARHIAEGDLYVFMDADLIVDKSWLRSIRKCDNVSIGWSQMIFLNKRGTEKVIKSKFNKIDKDTDVENIIKPNINGAAGGINVYTKEIFNEIKGWCEDYYGTYGGEDNSTWLKLKCLRYKIGILNAIVYHLYHSHMTYKHQRRFNILNSHKKWDENMWKIHVNNLVSWGNKF